MSGMYHLAVRACLLVAIGLAASCTGSDQPDATATLAPGAMPTRVIEGESDAIFVDDYSSEQEALNAFEVLAGTDVAIPSSVPAPLVLHLLSQEGADAVKRLRLDYARQDWDPNGGSAYDGPRVSITRVAGRVTLGNSAAPVDTGDPAVELLAIDSPAGVGYALYDGDVTYLVEAWGPGLPDDDELIAMTVSLLG